jgi:RHS repeat-associated protein
LIFSGGVVLERYEYDAYGDCHVLEPNYADDPDGKSDYGNPYLFTGRRVDILDEGSLKIQYNRNRYYDYYTGRWTTHDPLGYVDGMNLYEYVSSGPILFADPYGLLPLPGPIRGIGKLTKLVLRLPKMAMDVVCEKDRSWEIHPRLRVGLFVVTTDVKCDCNFGYSWVNTPKEKCVTMWDKGHWTLSRQPKSVWQAIKKLRVKGSVTYGNSVATASASAEVKGYLKALIKGGIKYRLDYSVDAEALKWIKSCNCGCGKCAKGFVSCTCKAGYKVNVLGGAAVAGAVATAYWALPALGPGAAAAARVAWEAAKAIPDPVVAAGG